MAAQVAPMRRPKLSLQINAAPVLQSIAPIIQSKPVLSLPIPTSAHPSKRPSLRFSYGDNSDSEEEDGKFWSGEEASSATSSSDDDEPISSKMGLLGGGNTVLLPSPSCLTSPFLPPPTGMRFPATPQKAGLKKLRLFTAIPPASSTSTITLATPIMTAPQTKQKLSLSIPFGAPLKRLSTPPLPVFESQQTPSLTKSGKPRKSVSFSTEPDSIITTTNYTLSNADLLHYISSEECTPEELSEKWGMTVEEGRMLGMPRSKVDRRERKWIGLTNSFLRDGCKKIVDSDEE
ncbi:hypothetical protein DFH27DRAFT_544098 [Peziza echinospora]|nr:hypothetical protein DFH27DRAFT_544098 [Peziza echinospora]